MAKEDEDEEDARGEANAVGGATTGELSPKAAGSEGRGSGGAGGAREDDEDDEDGVGEGAVARTLSGTVALKN